MRNILLELKKMMYYRKGFWCIVLFLAASLLSLAVTAQPQNLDMEKYWDGYTYYLEQVAGPYSSEKAAYIETEAQNIAEASKLREELLDRYYDGELSLREFEQQFSEQEKVLQYQQGFEVLYDQYLYVSENTENRFFLPTNGWNGLFEQNVFPFLLFLLILVLIVPVFCSEIGNQMDVLICTTREGKKAVSSQMVLAGTIAVLLCLLDGTVRFVFFNMKYGLPYGDAPLQSLSYFGEYTGKVSLMDGYWNMVLLRCVGGFTLAVFILFLSVLVRKYALTLFITASAVLLPYLALTSNQIHHFPHPLAFLMPLDFFKGTVISSDPMTEEEVTLFQEVSRTELYVMIIVLICAAIGLLFWIRKRTANQWNKSRKSRSLLSCLLLCALVLSGCSSASETNTGNTAYNTSAISSIPGYEMLLDEQNRPAYLRNLEDESTIMLNRSPFAESVNEGTIQSVFCQDDDVYYLKTRTESYIDRVGFYNSSVDLVSITKLDTQTLEETVVWEQVISTGRAVLGIEYNVPDRWEFLNKYHTFFLNEDSIFFACHTNIRKVDRKTNRVSIIDIPANHNIAFDGTSIYFLDSLSSLIRYDTFSGEKTELSGIVAEDFFLTEEAIFFINRLDNNKIYTCDLKGERIRKVADVSARSLTVDYQYIRYVDNANGKQGQIPRLYLIHP
mgnify:CR=1 FL=1